MKSALVETTKKIDALGTPSFGSLFFHTFGKKKVLPIGKNKNLKGGPGINSGKMVESLTLLTNQFSKFPYHPCMVYLPTTKYTIHGWYGNWTNQSKKSPGPNERTQNNLSI